MLYSHGYWPVIDFPIMTPSRHFLKSNLDGAFHSKELCKVTTTWKE